MKNKKLFAILTLVCFMFTLMPVAAFAADPFDAQSSTVGLADDSIKKGDVVNVELDLNATTETLYVWFEEVGYENAVVNAVTVTGVTQEADETEGFDSVSGSGVITVDVKAPADYVEFTVEINRAADFVVHAGTVNPAEATDWKFVEAAELRAAKDVEISVDPAADVSDEYALKVAAADAAAVTDEDGNDYIEDKEVATVYTGANGIETYEYSFNLVLPQRVESGDNKGDVVVNGTETKVDASALEVDATNGVVVDVDASRSGKVELEVTPLKAGVHKIYLTIGDYKATIKVDARDGEAEDIELSYISQTPVNIESVNNVISKGMHFGNWIVFQVYDASGRELTSAGEGSGFEKAVAGNNNYVSLIEQPADSDLENEDFKLQRAPITQMEIGGTIQTLAAEIGWTIAATSTSVEFEEEGKYTFKVALDDGAYATASIVVKEAGEPVALSIAYDADSVQLGGNITPKAISLLDASYVASTAEDFEFAATGAAIDRVDGTTIYVKDNEKYVGSTITVTVIDKENDLVATKTLTVADEANELAFDIDAVPVDIEKTVTVTLTDANGKAVALPNATSAQAYVLVLDKPADSDATISGEPFTVTPNKGQFRFGFSADKVGVYEVQAVLQVKVDNAWRYYTGVQEIKVGATGIEDTVVMSIGANKIVVNDEVVAIDAAPMIKDSRTFVPFRALAEAFGATVEFDAATQAVVAELDGTKVVMTIGSEVYTVNGVAKTADVAPFISDSRTMVPVRFAAEAFGITVTPIYAEDGSVADVLFTK